MVCGFRLRERFPGLARQAGLVAVALEGGLAVRLGESAVASTMVHALDPREPSTVQVLRDADAGCVFYGRADRGAVVHLDVFHSPGEVDHRAAAQAVREAVSGYARDFPGAAPLRREDLAGAIDMQTATGGGRVSGGLAGGRKPSLRKAHRNHIHLAIALPPGGYPLLFYLVAAAEAVIAAQGLEIRRVDRVVLRSGTLSGGLEHYRGESDSLLRAGAAEWQGRFGQAVRLAERIEGAAAARRLLERWTGGGRGDAAAGPAADDTGTAGRGPGSPGVGGSRKCGAWAGGAVSAGRADDRGLQACEAAAAATAWLYREGLIIADPSGHRLSDAGRAVLDILARHSREVDLALKQLARVRLGGPAGRFLGASSPGSSFARDAVVRGGAGRRLVAWAPGRPPAAPALPETVAAAARRLAGEALHTTAGCPVRLEVTAADLRSWERRRARAIDLCLLIDASASMAGPRIAAAKELARQLLLQTRDRVAVLTFQERQVAVPVPFTRNYSLIQEGLRRIEPAGLTPLALALREAAGFLHGRGRRRTLLVLITDGIPTVALASADPVADALAEAARLGGKRLRLACIGMQPNAGFLQRLAAASGASLHVVNDLEKETLLAITYAERRLLTGGRIRSR